LIWIKLAACLFDKIQLVLADGAKALARPRLRSSVLATLALLATMNSLMALTPSEQRGQTFALNNCAKCHSTDKVSPSPLRIAPPFRSLHTKYPIESLAEAFAEGIYTGHPTMPQFQLDPDHIHDLLMFMKTLE
jgi:cytochrome c